MIGKDFTNNDSTWEDRYFNNEANVIAVFDYDYPTVEEVTVKDLRYRIRFLRMYLIFFVIFMMLGNYMAKIDSIDLLVSNFHFHEKFAFKKIMM